MEHAEIVETKGIALTATESKKLMIEVEDNVDHKQNEQPLLLAKSLETAVSFPKVCDDEITSQITLENIMYQENIKQTTDIYTSENIHDIENIDQFFFLNTDESVKAKEDRINEHNDDEFLMGGLMLSDNKF